MRTSVAFLSSMAFAMARAVAFDVRAIGVLLVDMMLKYIGFHLTRQQICRGKALCDSRTDVGCRHMARSQSKADQRLNTNGHVEPHLSPRIQIHEGGLGNGGNARQCG